jgi:ribosomal protein S12 methylthiotransferase
LLGYPGETEQDVEELLSLVEEVRVRHLGCFTYSDEDGTHAFDLTPKVSQEEMDERMDRVMSLQRQIALEDNLARVGETVEVVIDGVAEGQDYHFTGRTEGDAPEVDNQVLIFAADGQGENAGAEPGSFRKVLITDAREYDLEAKLLP